MCINLCHFPPWIWWESWTKGNNVFPTFLQSLEPNWDRKEAVKRPRLTAGSRLVQQGAGDATRSGPSLCVCMCEAGRVFTWHTGGTCVSIVLGGLNSAQKEIYSHSGCVPQTEQSSPPPVWRIVGQPQRGENQEQGHGRVGGLQAAMSVGHVTWRGFTSRWDRGAKTREHRQVAGSIRGFGRILDKYAKIPASADAVNLFL